MDQRRELGHLPLQGDRLASLLLQRPDLGLEALVLRVQRSDVRKPAEERAERMDHVAHRALERADDGERALARHLEGSAGAAPVIDGDGEEARHHQRDDERAGVAGAAVERHRGGRAYPRLEATSTLFRPSNSSRHLPDPMTTQDRGDSATWMGMPVSCLSRSSSPFRSAPPPVRTMPLSITSAASSGGHRSRVFFTASMIEFTGSSMAFRTSSAVMWIVLGRPLTRSRPLIS